MKYRVWCFKEEDWIYSSNNKRNAIQAAREHRKPPNNHAVEVVDLTLFILKYPINTTKLLDGLKLDDLKKGEDYEIVEF